MLYYDYNKTTAVAECYQHSATCAGDRSTYTTAEAAPSGSSIPCFATFGKIRLL